MIHVKDAPRPTHARPSLARSDDVRDYDWGASGWAGVVAGVLYIVLDSTLIALFANGSSSDFVRQIAAIAMGPSAPRTTFTGLVYFAALAVHLPLSLIYARIISAVVQRLDAARATACGAFMGAGLYFLNYYMFTHFFPWFSAGRGWIALVSHVFFGGVAAWVYIAETAKTRRSRRAALAR